jgi:hypothetical protein
MIRNGYAINSHRMLYEKCEIMLMFGKHSAL